MSILVRNEDDIIEDNILFHLHHGVDAFIISDNASTDGTRDILNKLARNHPIHIIDRPNGEYRQSKWVTEMAQIAYKMFNANWVINNDADEFWLPINGDIKSHLSYKDTVVAVARGNMLIPERGKDYYESTWRVSTPITYPPETQPDVSVQMSLLLLSVREKVILNPRGIFKVRGGNHDAYHIYKLLGSRVEDNIFIYHFQIRSYEKFVAQAKQGAVLLKNNPATRMGNHLRRWAKMWEAGTLEEEYERFLFTRDETRTLEKIGIINEDTRFKDALLAVKK